MNDWQILQEGFLVSPACPDGWIKSRTQCRGANVSSHFESQTVFLLYSLSTFGRSSGKQQQLAAGTFAFKISSHVCRKVFFIFFTVLSQMMREYLQAIAVVNCLQVLLRKTFTRQTCGFLPAPTSRAAIGSFVWAGTNHRFGSEICDDVLLMWAWGSRKCCITWPLMGPWWALDQQSHWKLILLVLLVVQGVKKGS